MYELEPTLHQWEFAAQNAAQYEFASGALEGESETAMESPFTEAEELELAAELLTLSNEEELDQFLGKVIKKAGKFVKGPLVTVLKTVAKTALPIAGRVAGSFFGGPLGGALGSKLGSALSSALETELEGISPAEQELEAARRFVRFAGTAAVKASRTPLKQRPWSTVRNAAFYAAQRHLPSLLRRKPIFKRPVMPSKPLGGSVWLGDGWTPRISFPFAGTNAVDMDVLSTSGHWLRQGPQIVILNCHGSAPATQLPLTQLSSSLAGDEATAGDEGSESAGALFQQPYPMSKEDDMHDLDRTQFESGYGAFESGPFEFAFEGEYSGVNGESPFNESEEMELAAELLGVNSEAELDQFLGNLIKRGARAVGGFIRSPTGQALVGIAKDAARQALPSIGQAIGSRFGGATGGNIGSQLASGLGSLLGLEMEGPDHEFEAAQQFVRVIGSAAANAATAPAQNAPDAAAKSALTVAAKQFAPGLLRLLARLRARRGRPPAYRTANTQNGAVVGTPFSEADEMELAAELLGVSSEAELDQFLGNLIKRGAQLVGKGVQAVSTFANSPTGQALGGILKGAAKQVLPIAGAAVGAKFGSPQLGSMLASGLGSIFGLELEGLSHEDQEFEMARHFVRFGGAAAANAAAAPTTASPQATATSAAQAAAQQFAPGLIRPIVGSQHPHTGGNGQGGRWVRRGNQIILYGV